MKMALFLSTITSKIDAKYRVSIPSAFRTILTDLQTDLILYPSFQYPCLEGCGSDALMALVEKLEAEYTAFDRQKEEVQSLVFGSAKAFVIDSTGRISLTPEFMKHASLTDEAVFIGCGKNFQIWNKNIWEKELAKRQATFANGGNKK